MIRGLFGSLIAKKTDAIILDVNGVNYRVFMSPKTIASLPELGGDLQVFTYLKVKEDALDLFGFLNESELSFFEKLLTVSGVGPRTALGIMAVAPVEQLVAAVSEAKVDLLTRAAGVGRKTAERVVLELKGKLASLDSGSIVRTMESDLELEEALVGLGYSKAEARKAIAKIEKASGSFEEKLKKALKAIKY